MEAAEDENSVVMGIETSAGADAQVEDEGEANISTDPARTKRDVEAFDPFANGGMGAGEMSDSQFANEGMGTGEISDTDYWEALGSSGCVVLGLRLGWSNGKDTTLT